MKFSRNTLATTVAGAFALASLSGAAVADDDPIQIAFGDIASIESLNLLIAIERTKERGVPVELTFFNSEDVATQAVVSGQADIGVGAPYAFIQNSGAPLRMFYRMSTLLFFPVVNGEVYSGWEDLDGEEVAVHSRGSGTEALMRLMESIHDIEFSNISYVPGAEVRAGALLQGTINATIVDPASWRLLEEEGEGRFQRLPVEGVNATDEALYANITFLEEQADDVQVLVEELLGTWNDIADDPQIVGDLREEYDLLPDLPAEMDDEVVAFYEEAVENGVFPLDGGQPEDAGDDLEFLAAAGQVDSPEELNIEDYWHFEALEAARAAQD
ncbi:ABC transporter substrate-binding protein [Fodinicurvata sp. EGI_FJ10296]|uniref:ABC transporter substrate-binding protein n=1 Tax=Fodinicurvata sp. EGI_FJ10296 TaxID=3231908 RepID=UPI0034535CAC